ncbi:MAG: DUF992 domain-containing protein [Rhizobiaceae bacterium]|nr:DUF992 domain-containing protein [Rhizobiaceae bacterium]
MRILSNLSAAIVLTIAGSTAALAEQIKVGQLDCDLSAGLGAIIGSQQEVNCLFTPSVPGPSKTYVGKITQFGFDIGKIEKSRMIWLVYSTTGRKDGGVEGTYRGVSADASVDVGLGANVLVGGDHGSLSLQPISVETEDGFNIAVGVAEMKLRLAE